MKKIIWIIFIIITIAHPCIAVEADDSVDEIIKKTFNAGDSTLPKLPKTSPKSVESLNFLDTHQSEITVQQNPVSTNSPTTINSTINSTSDIPKVPQKVNIKTAKIGWGKKVNVKFNTNVSDHTQKGTRVSFITQAPILAKGITLPAGTIFYGTVTNSHSPQMLGNGGLLSIKADYVTYRGKTSYCEGNIIAVNHKTVLFNNIKGNNGYFKGIAKTTKPAREFYGKSVKVTKKLWNGPGFILTPFTYLPGAVFLVGDTIVSPFIALFHKGERVYISKGTTATIKLTSPTYIEY